MIEEEDGGGGGDGEEEGGEAAREGRKAAGWGTMPEPVAAMIEGSAWRRSHSMVSPSVRWPSSRVSWKIRAAQRAGIRTLLPRPFTFVWRSLLAAGAGASAEDAGEEAALRLGAFWCLSCASSRRCGAERAIGGVGAEGEEGVGL